jgi:multiple sugar transport system ATP-binding protein
MAAVAAKHMGGFGDVAAVDGVSLSVCDGEFLVLLGRVAARPPPRIIAGLERQTSATS